MGGMSFLASGNTAFSIPCGLVFLHTIFLGVICMILDFVLACMQISATNLHDPGLCLLHDFSLICNCMAYLNVGTIV